MISQGKKQKISDWWELRTGYRQLHALFFHEPILGGSSYAYVFGHVLLFVVIFQAMTGILLALFYSPSISAAWAVSRIHSRQSDIRMVYSWIA